MTTAIYLILLSIIHACLATCSPAYGAKPCTYVPAPPGHSPKCARPGLTYCEHPYDYPGHIIKNLLEKWKYDHSTLIINESQDDFNSYYYNPTVEYTTKPYPGYMYSYPYDISNASGDKLNTHNDYYPYPPARNNSGYDPTLGYFDDRKKYPSKTFQNTFTKFSDNVFHYPNAPGLYHRGRDPFPGGLQSNWWKRYGNREAKKYFYMRRRRSAHFNFYKNGTSAVRTKRQTLSSSQTLCQTRSDFIMPRAALNNKGNWMYVVNMPDVNNNLAQLVKSETCISQQCSGLCALPAGVTSRCEQKYVQKRLVALEGTGNQLYTDVFWFPSCCICTITGNNL